MVQVFISYTRRTPYDIQYAETIRTWLLQNGFDVWMDVHNIPGGVHWDSEIDKALQTSDVVLGLVSPASVGSDNVLNEWAWALSKGKLQLVLISQAEIPHRYYRIDYTNLTKNDPAQWRKLYEILKTPPRPAQSAAPAPRKSSNPIQQVVDTVLGVFGRGRVPKNVPSFGKQRNGCTIAAAGIGGAGVAGLVICGVLLWIIGALGEVNTYTPYVDPGANTLVEQVNTAQIAADFLFAFYTIPDVNTVASYICPSLRSQFIQQHGQFWLQYGGQIQLLGTTTCVQTTGSSVQCTYQLQAATGLVGTMSHVFDVTSAGVCSPSVMPLTWQ